MHLNPPLYPPESESSSSMLMGRFFLAGLTYLAFPTVSKKISEAIDKLGFSPLIQRGKDQFNSLARESVKKFVEMGGPRAETAVKVSTQGLFYLGQGLTCLDEFASRDFQLKDPSISIEMNRKRLSAHNLPFSNCVDFLAKEAAQLFLDNSEEIISKICDIIAKNPLNQTVDLEEGAEPSLISMTKRGGVDWFLSLSKDLIAQTIKANILHIIANLADEGYKADYTFEDKQRNPLGRALSVIGNCLVKYEKRLNAIVLLPNDEQTKERQFIFTELSADLLKKIFPKEEQDLQLFHPHIPCIRVIKKIVWGKINHELPNLLERLYLETRHLDLEQPDWKEQFDEYAYGLKADQLIDLPSNLLKHFIRGNRARSLNSLQPLIEKSLIKKEYSKIDAEELSAYLIKYAKEFLLTEEPTLHKMGSFIERYFMERILFNLSQFFPENKDYPMPLSLTKQWIEGDLFKTFNQAMTGKILKNEDKVKAINQFLAPFGLIQEESFPLPPSIKNKIWPGIEYLLKEKIPPAFFKAVPKWISLEKRTHNQKKLDASFGDPSLKKAISHISHTLTEKIWKSIELIPSIGKNINGSLSSLILSEEQESTLDEQWQAFLKENHSIELLKNFGEECVEAFILQISTDLYSQLVEMRAFEGMRVLFSEADDSLETIESPLPESFPAWLLIEITQACESLVIDGESGEKLEALKRAIDLKNEMRHSENKEQVKKVQAELDKLWIEIQPKFERVFKYLLGILGYKTALDLPFPKEFQAIIWKNLVEKMPYLLFEQSSDILIPLLEKKKLQIEVEKLKNGLLIKQGSQLLAQDIVNHLPEWLDGKLKTLSEEISAEESDMHLTSKARDYLIDSLQMIAKSGDLAYKPFWKWLESYLEGVFLKIGSQIGKMEKSDFDQFFIFIQQTKDKLFKLEQLEKEAKFKSENKIAAEEKILIQFTDQISGFLKINLPKDLWGIPQFLQEMLLKEIKLKTAKLLVGISHTEQKIRHHIVKVNVIEDHIPTPKLSKAVHAVTQFALSKVTFELNQEVDKKAVKGVSQIYQSLNTWLSKKEKLNYKIASFFKEVIAKEIPTPSLIQLLEQLEISSHEIYKQKLVEWANPILTDQALYYLTTLLKKEEKGKAIFDREIVLAFVPVLMSHLKHLNQAEQIPGGLNYKNYIDVSKGDIHSAIPLVLENEEKEKEQKQDHFYKNQAHLIFQLIFPNGKADLAPFLPDVELSEDQFTQIQESAQSIIAGQLPLAIEAIFDKETLVLAFISIFETAIDTLDLPIDLNVPKKPPLTGDELIQQKEMDKQVGQLIIEIAKFIDLPIEFLEKMPSWLKNGIKNSAFESIGEKVRERFNGKFFETQIPILLSNMEKRKFEKLTPTERNEALKKAEKDLKELEKRFVEKSLDYFIRYWGARLEKATDIFPHPVMKFFRKVILSVSSFMMVTLLGSVLRILKIDKLFVNSLHAMLHHRNQKIQTVFSQPLFHEDFVYRGVEALETVLLKKDAG